MEPEWGKPMAVTGCAHPHKLELHLFKGAIDTFKPSPWRILITDDTEIPCSINVVFLLAHKHLATYGRKTNSYFGLDKIFELINSQS